MFKKISLFCITLMLLISVFSPSVYAYMPPHSLEVNINRNAMPNGTAYIDLLIPIHKNDENFVQQKDSIYTVFNISDNAVLDIQNTSEIALFDNGYYSYLFHFKDSTIDTAEYQDTLHITYGLDQKLLDDIVQVENCKLAFVDEKGNILETTEDFMLREHLFKDFREVVVVETSVSVIYNTNPYRIVFAIILTSVLILLGIVIATVMKRRKKGNRGQSA